MVKYTAWIRIDPEFVFFAWTTRLRSRNRPWRICLPASGSRSCSNSASGSGRFATVHRMTDHFRDMLGALKKCDVEFLVVGAHALAAHGIIRATSDFDIWIRPHPDNAGRVWRALAEFGAPMDQLSLADFESPGMIVQIGVAPNRIDLLDDGQRY